MYRIQSKCWACYKSSVSIHKTTPREVYRKTATKIYVHVIFVYFTIYLNVYDIFFKK